MNLLEPLIIAIAALVGGGAAQRQVVSIPTVRINAVRNYERLAAILGDDCDVAADDLTNTFFIRASQEKIKLAKYIIRRAEDASSGSALHVVSLKHADAARSAKALILLLGLEQDVFGRLYSVHVSVDSRTNSVIIDARPEKIREAMDILGILDAKE